MTEEPTEQEQKKIDKVVEEVKTETIEKNLTIEQVAELLDKKFEAMRKNGHLHGEDIDAIADRVLDKLLAVIQDDVTNGKVPSEKEPAAEPAKKKEDKPTEEQKNKEDSEDSIFKYFR